jgi:hypothetical protein
MPQGNLIDIDKLEQENERLRAIFRHILALVSDRQRPLADRLAEIGHDARSAIGRDDSIARQVAQRRR